MVDIPKEKPQWLDGVLGEIEEEILVLEVEFVEPRRVLGEEVLHVHILHGVEVGLEGRPGGGVLDVRHDAWIGVCTDAGSG